MQIVRFSLPKWFLYKNHLLSKCSSDRHNGYGYVPSDIFTADKESTNSYHIPDIGWVPKSIVLNLQVKDYDLDMLIKQKHNLQVRKQEAHAQYKLTHSDESFDIEDYLLTQLRILEHIISDVSLHHIVSVNQYSNKGEQYD